MTVLKRELLVRSSRLSLGVMLQLFCLFNETSAYIPAEARTTHRICTGSKTRDNFETIGEPNSGMYMRGQQLMTYFLSTRIISLHRPHFEPSLSGRSTCLANEVTFMS